MSDANNNQHTSQTKLKVEQNNEKCQTSELEQNKIKKKVSYICKIDDNNQYELLDTIKNTEFENWLSVSLALEIFLKFLRLHINKLVEIEYSEFKKKFLQTSDPKTKTKNEKVSKEQSSKEAGKKAPNEAGKKAPKEDDKKDSKEDEIKVPKEDGKQNPKEAGKKVSKDADNEKMKTASTKLEDEKLEDVKLEDIEAYLKTRVDENDDVPDTDYLKNLVEIVNDNKKFNKDEISRKIIENLMPEKNKKLFDENDRSTHFSESLSLIKYFRIYKSTEAILGIKGCEFNEILELKKEIMCDNQQRFSIAHTDKCFYVIANILSSLDNSKILVNKDKDSLKKTKIAITYAREAVIKVTLDNKEKQNSTSTEKKHVIDQTKTSNNLQKQFENLEKSTEDFERFFDKIYNI